MSMEVDTPLGSILSTVPITNKPPKVTLSEFVVSKGTEEGKC